MRLVFHALHQRNSLNYKNELMFDNLIKYLRCRLCILSNILLWQRREDIILPLIEVGGEARKRSKHRRHL